MGRQALHGAPVRRMEVNKAEVLALRVMEAWLRLTAKKDPEPVTLYLTERGSIAGLSPYLPRKPGYEIGTYSKDCTVEELRDDVFDAFGKMQKNRSSDA